VLASRRRSAAYEPIAAPVLHGERYGGRPVYFSDVIVAADSDVRSFADLRGRSFAYNEPSSHSGYGVVRYKLVTLGETHGFFGSVVRSGAHYRSIEMVASGGVDASAIDSQVLALELRDQPRLHERLRVIDSLGPSTIQPVVAARHVPGLVRARVREALLRMGDDPAARSFLDRGLVARFAAADSASYDDVRAMTRAAEQAHFLVLR
jgi:phosphonate transport system substrate-binding protein